MQVGTTQQLSSLFTTTDMATTFTMETMATMSTLSTRLLEAEAEVELVPSLSLFVSAPLSAMDFVRMEFVEEIKVRWKMPKRLLNMLNQSHSLNTRWLLQPPQLPRISSSQVTQWVEECQWVDTKWAEECQCRLSTHNNR